MFKKIYEKIADLKQYIRNIHDIQCNNNDDSARKILSATSSILSKLETTKRYESTIESQQRTIEQLTNALKDKYEHGLFIFSEDCKIPTVIRNGKELTNELTSCFSIDWEYGAAPNITIEQFAGTVHDMEK